MLERGLVTKQIRLGLTQDTLKATRTTLYTEREKTAKTLKRERRKAAWKGLKIGTGVGAAAAFLVALFL